MSADRISPLFGSSFGSLLRRYREAAGLTQEALAERAGLSVRGISDLERGVRLAPRHETVELLATALGLSPHRRALLEAAARPMTTADQPQGTMPSVGLPTNLPAQMTPLIGRERDARRAAEMLMRAETRLLTLTGPGGAGKTRLALQVAEDVLERFEDGVYVVTLAPLTEPTLVMQTITETIGLRTMANSPLPEQVRAALAGKQMLLVLDNFEHVLAATSQVTDLLAACPRLKVLVTSREPLKVGGEREMLVAPLDEAAAAQLFVERAQATHPGFEPAPHEWKTVAAICDQLDRLPLAVELAAGWVRILPLPVLLERLDRRLELLNLGRRDAPDRQRTLRDTIAWSELLLEPRDRRLFRQLAVCAGGWSLDAAETICDGAETSAGGADHGGGIAAGKDGGVLAGLARLVEKSLVQAEPEAMGAAAAEARFTMLATIREFAWERLLASDEAEAIQRRHAQYFARLTTEAGWVGPQLDERDQRIERDLPNIRAALAWARAQREPEVGLRLATPMGRWWYTRGAFDEAEGWLRALLALDAQAGEHTAPAGLRVSALYALVLIALDRRQYNTAETLAREGLELANRHGDATRAGNMLAELGHIAEARSDLAAATTFFEESLAQYESGDGHAVGAAVGRTLSSLGNLERAKGNYNQARAYLERALAWARERDFSFAIASGLVSLGHVAVEQGDYARARAVYGEALERFRALRNPTSLAWCLEGVAIVTCAGGAHEAVARLTGAIASLHAGAGASEGVAWPPYVQAREASRQALGVDAYAVAHAHGAALGAERAITYALALLGSNVSEQT